MRQKITPPTPGNQHVVSLIYMHAELVRRIADYLARHLRAHIEKDDLVQAGMIGLIEASKNYDKKHGAAFATYAAIRIRGAMIDEVRRGDWVPRSIHRRARNATCAIRKIEQRTGRSASDPEIAQELHMRLSDYLHLSEEVLRGHIVSLDAQLEEHGELDSLCKAGPTPQQWIERRQFAQQLHIGINQLPPREKKILLLHYEDEWNLKKIAKFYGVSESRVCQMLNHAMSQLRHRMKLFELADSGIFDKEN